MSRRTAEANKAIKLAWERERDLVQQGKGTRDWTKEQQEDILDPNKGKAYDENGRAFEGQHMKSVVEHPEYQGNPDNIQFLTKEEHLEAHRGSWQNPTNWYYNPETKEYFEFGENELIPCKVMVLSSPIAVSSVNECEPRLTDEKQIEEEQRQPMEKALTQEESDSSNDTREQKTDRVITPLKASRPIKVKKNDDGMSKAVRFIRKGLKFVGRVIIENPEIVEAVGGALISKVASGVRSRSASTNTGICNSGQSNAIVNTSVSSDSIGVKPDISTRPYKPNDVGACPQRYHYKDGSVRWKVKVPYHREGKNE